MSATACAETRATVRAGRHCPRAGQSPTTTTTAPGPGAGAGRHPPPPGGPAHGLLVRSNQFQTSRRSRSAPTRR
jgi:hypothetical protein